MGRGLEAPLRKDDPPLTTRNSRDDDDWCIVLFYWLCPSMRNHIWHMLKVSTKNSIVLVFHSKVSPAIRALLFSHCRKTRASYYLDIVMLVDDTHQGLVRVLIRRIMLSQTRHHKWWYDDDGVSSILDLDQPTLVFSPREARAVKWRVDKPLWRTDYYPLNEQCIDFVLLFCVLISRW